MYNKISFKPISKTRVQSSSAPQPRYTPSAPIQTLTHSPATLSQRQFEQLIHDENQDIGQMLMPQAMITATDADGHIDEDERQRIYQQVNIFDLNTEEKACLLYKLPRPLLSQELNKQINIYTVIYIVTLHNYYQKITI
jgi:uncharacterized membrane protein YebE (DUF533 family)